MLVPLEFLWLPALSVAIFGAWVMVRLMKTGRLLALSLALLKVVIPLLYFAYFFRSGWTLVDDLTYFEQARLLLLKGNNPFLILFTQDGRERLFSIAGGQHILYYWWNLLAVYLFKPVYSAPVFLNVATTFISAAILFRIARLSGRARRPPIDVKRMVPNNASEMPTLPRMMYFQPASKEVFWL